MKAEDLIVGKEAVYFLHRLGTFSNIPPEAFIGTVDRVTKTQVVVDRRRFAKNTGRVIGGESAHLAIHTSFADAQEGCYGQLWTVEEAEEHNRMYRDAITRCDLILDIRSLVEQRKIMDALDVTDLKSVYTTLNNGG